MALLLTYNGGVAARKRPEPLPPPRRRQETPAQQGLHPVSLILSEALYEGLRLYCFTNRMKHQELLRKLLGEFLASKGLTKVVRGEDGKVDYHLERPPPRPLE
jgi:hypothetical protein